MKFTSSRFLLAASTLITSAFADPTLTGALVGGQPSWDLTLPGSLGAWTDAVIHISNNGSIGFFDYTSATVFRNGQAIDDATTSVYGSGIDVSIDFSIGAEDEIVISYDGTIRTGLQFTSNAHVEINFPDVKLAKRAVTTYDLSYTVNADGESSSSSDDGQITSTVTEDDVSTTVITVTSCDATHCTEEPVTTGVTVVTETISGVVTSYTTYCPLTTETVTEDHQSTTVVTITSCEEDKCHEVPVTTGVTVITKDVTTYTTYCPLTSTVVVPSEKPTEAPAKPTEAPAKPTEAPTEAPAKPTTAAPEVPTTPAISTLEVTSTVSNPSGPAQPSVSVFDNAAAGKLVAGTGMLGLFAGFLFL